MKKNKIFKPFLSLILSLIMIFSDCITALPELGSVEVLAAESEGGTTYSEPEKADDVYQIKTADELMWFAAHVNEGNSSAKAVLLNDIDMTGKTWTPIGKTKALAYRGTFDGQGHRIKNLVIDSTEDNQGLFGFIGAGAVGAERIKNLTIDKSCSIKGGSNVGAIAAVAFADNANNCKVEYCANEAAVTGKENVGGIVGVLNNISKTVAINYCYNVGTITAENSSAGLVGALAVTGWKQVYFSCCYSVGAMTGSGTQYVRNYSNCYTLNMTQNATSSKSSTPTISFKEEDLASGKLAWLLNGSEDEGIYKQTLGEDAYPNFTGYDVSYSDDKGYYNKAPDQVDGVYQIETAGDLMWFAAHVNEGNASVAAVLVKDIDMTGKTWTPIGKTNALAYRGTFDGQGHRIKNLVIDSTEDNQGLFGFIGGGVFIKNLTIDKSCSIRGGSNVGAIAAVASADNANNCKWESCANEAAVTGKENVGGIVGVLKNISKTVAIKYCYNVGTITAENSSAGLVGALVATSFRQVYFSYCYSVGAMTGSGTQYVRNYTNCYTLNMTQNATSSATSTPTISFKEEDLASGKLAWLLNDSKDEGIYKQTLGEDAYPNFTGYDVSYSDDKGYYNKTPDQVDGDNETPDQADGVYQIETADELMWFAAHVNEGNSSAKAVLLNDIDMTGKTWTPIGNTEQLAYTGTFDGQLHKIKNLVVNSENVGMGLFGYADNGATIKNTIIGSGSSITAKRCVAGILGTAVLKGAVTIENCGNEANISATERLAAGIIGSCYNKTGTLTVKNCYNTGTIKAPNNAAGLCGLAAKYPKMYFTNCWNSGKYEVDEGQTSGAVFGGDIDKFDEQLVNCYTLNTTQLGSISFEETDLTSGRLTWLLNGKSAEGVWKQTLGTDAHPNFTGEPVYYLEESSSYTNEPSPLYIVRAIPVMEEGDIRYLDYVDLVNTGDVETVVSSSAEEVAVVTNWEYVNAEGNQVRCLEIDAIAAGEAVITITRGEYTATFTVTVEKDDTPEEIALIKQRWKKSLFLDYMSNYEDTNASNIKTLSDTADELWNSMNREFDGEPPWEVDNTADVICGRQFANLKSLALVFAIEGTNLYHNPEVARAISDAMQYMTGTGKYAGICYKWTYNTKNRGQGNWFNWDIGANLNQIPIFFAMEPVFEDEEIIWYTDVLGTFDTIAKIDSIAGIANASWIAQGVLAVGLFQNDETWINAVKNSKALTGAMAIKDNYASWGNGYYADGSIIEHDVHPYTAGYGLTVVRILGNYFYLFEGTEYNFDKDLRDKLLSFTIDAFLPMIYKGNIMSITRGREVSRNSAELVSGFEAMSCLATMYMENPDETIRETVLGAIKYNLEEVVEYFGEDALNNAILRDVYNDDSITALPYHKFKAYGAMCRYVKTTDAYAAALALTNQHIASYECINNENFYSWYQGAGALYVYNDLEQFFPAYWPTRDPYRTTGVTADTTTLAKAKGQSATSGNKIAGGATDGNLGAIAYDFNASYVGLNTKAKKSYFFLDEGIVQMGTAISGTTGATIETTIDARILNEDGSNKITIYDAENQKQYQFTDTEEKQKIHLAAGSWIHMEGNREDVSTDMAYYFPMDTDIEMDVQFREGNVSNINNSYEGAYSCWYLMIGINHGTGTVSDESYVYVTLPSMSLDGIKDYAENNTLELVDGVVENGNGYVHVIKNNSGTMMAVNCYSSDSYKADWLTMNGGDGNVSLIVTEDTGVYTLSVADSTPKGTKLTFISDYKMDVISKSDEITVAESGKEFTVDVKNAGSQSFQMTFTLEGKEPTIFWPTAEKISAGKTLADIQLTGGSTSGSFAWEKPETVLEAGTRTYTMVFTNVLGKTYTKEIEVTVEAVSSGNEGDSGNSGTGGSDSGNTGTGGSDSGNTGTGGSDSGNTGSGSTDSGNTGSGSTGTGSNDSDNTTNTVTGTVQGSATNQGQSSATNQLQSSPKTGDTTPVAALVVTLLLSGMCILVLLLYKKRKNDCMTD